MSQNLTNTAAEFSKNCRRIFLKYNHRILEGLKPPPTERTVEDQPFFLLHKHPDNPRERIDIASGSFSIHTSQLEEHEALARKTAAAFRIALSIAEYVYNQIEISEECKAGLHHLKLDMVAGSIFAWRTVHNMLMSRSLALDNLSRTIPQIDSDQKVVLISRTFQGYYPFQRRVSQAAESQQGTC